jgi:hypothetical protein
MGNGESKFLYITTNSTVYAPGEHIHGEVYLKLQENMTSDSLIIDIEGLESYQIEEKQKNFSESNQIFHKVIILYNWPNSVAEKGDYTFPFNFKLPINIPGSTVIELSNITAFIRYRVKALISQEFYKEREFKIKSKSNLSNTLQKNQASSSFKVKRMICVNRGVIEMQVSLNKFEYTSEDILRIEVNGICDILPYVFCYVYRIVGVRVDGVYKIVKSKICKIKVTENEIDLDLKSFEGRICKNTSTEGKFISCSYIFKVVTDKKVCCSGINELVLTFQLNSGRDEPATPRYSIPFKPRMIRCQLIDEAYSYDEGFSFYGSNFE